MPSRTESGKAVNTYRPRKPKRTAPASQGHPSRGSSGVGGGTKGRRPKRYKSPTPTSPTIAPVSDIRTRGDRAPRGSGYSTRKQRIKQNRKERRSAIRQLAAGERARLRSITDPRDVGDAPNLGGIPSPAAARAESREQSRIARDIEALHSNTTGRYHRTEAAERLADSGTVTSAAERLAKKNLTRSEEVRREVVRDYESGKIRTKADKERAAAKLKVAGFGPTDLDAVLKVPVEVAKATYEDPGGVAKGTLRGVKDTIVGIPSAAVKAVTDPEEAVNQIVEDYKYRYGPLVAGDERAFRERIKKEGLTAEALDIAGVASVAGRAAGLGARVGRVPKARPKLRTTGGAAREQRVSRNLIVEAGQRLQDKARRKTTSRRIARSDKTGGRVDALDVSLLPDEVAPIRRRRRQRRAPAELKSRGVQAMKGEQVREVHRGASRAIAKLNRHEKRGFKYALQLGIRDAKTGRRVLERRRAQILEARKAEGTEIPKALRKTNDELRAIDAILAAPEKVFTARLARIADQERGRSVRLGRSDPALAPEQRLLRSHAPVAEHLGVARREGEGTASFVRRVKEEGRKQGLTDPAYFPSQKRPTIRYSDYALGGTRAVAEDKHYTGALFRTGREDVRPEAFTQGLAKNIKRKHNWGTVADNFDTNAYEWGRDRPLSKLLDELDARGIDPSTVAFWNPRKYREARQNLEGKDFVEEVAGEDIVPPGLTDAVDVSATDLKGLATKGEEFRNTSGWSVVPKVVYDEIHADTRPSGAVARSFDVLKGKQSRILLGTNPPWLAFQTASNVLLTALAKTGPIDALKAQVWWRKLSPETRAEIEPYVGLGPFQMDVQQTKLGASTNNRLVNGYRAFKQTPFLQKTSKANPLDLLFRADNAQNNFFRRSVLYSQAKRDTYRRLGQDVGKVAATQERLKGLFTLGPRKQMEQVIRDKRVIEQHAEYVNRMLGDYATYTARERRTLGRGIMFYGFLRFSLHFAFWTMPSRHPVVTSIIGNLARLETEEVRQLLGGDELPFALGRLYITKDGKLQTVELGRANPATNALTELLQPYEGGIQFVPRRALSMLPPMVGAALDIAYGKNAFSNRPLRVRGEHNYAAGEREQSGEEIGMEDRGRIAAERFLDLFYPYRVAESMAFEDQPQGDDSLLWDPRPTKFKDEEILHDLDVQRRRHGKRNVLLEELTPFLPHESRDPEIAAGLRERRNGKKAGGKFFDSVRGDSPRKKFFDDVKGSGWDSYRDEARAWLDEQANGGESYADEARKWLDDNGAQSEFDEWRDQDEGDVQDEFDKWSKYRGKSKSRSGKWDQYR